MSIERKKAKIEINKLDIELKELEIQLLKVKNALLNVEIELSEESVTMEDLQVLAEDLLERYSKEELDKLIEDIEAKEKTAEDGSKYLDTDFEEFKIYSIVQMGMYNALIRDLSNDKIELLNKSKELTEKLIEMY